MKTYDFELSGITPLLMHADDVERADDLDAWRKNPANKNISKPGDDRSPAWTWQTYCYSDGKVLCVPTENLLTCLRAAGAEIAMKGQKTFKAATQTGLLVEQEYLPLLVNGDQVLVADIDAIASEKFGDHKHAVDKLGFRLFVKRAKVGTNKHVRVRPRFDSWKLRGRIIAMTPEFTPEVMQTLFRVAGLTKGLGDWRAASPKSPGPFGRFETVLKEVA